MNQVQSIVVYRGCEIKAMPHDRGWQVWFRTTRQAKNNVAFRPFDQTSFNSPDAAIASLKSFLDARSKTPWLFSESGKFLGRSLEA